jgi:hypothetical protein
MMEVEKKNHVLIIESIVNGIASHDDSNEFGKVSKGGGGEGCFFIVVGRRGFFWIR